MYVWPIKSYFLQLEENFLRQCLKTNQFNAESKTAPEETAVEAELKIMFPVFPRIKRKWKKKMLINNKLVENRYLNKCIMENFFKFRAFRVQFWASPRSVFATYKIV